MKECQSNNIDETLKEAIRITEERTGVSVFKKETVRPPRTQREFMERVEVYKAYQEMMYPLLVAQARRLALQPITTFYIDESQVSKEVLDKLPRKP